MTLVLSAEWRVSNCAKIHPLRRLRDNVSLEAVAGGIRGGKGGKSRGEEEEKGRQKDISTPDGEKRTSREGSQGKGGKEEI